GKAQRSGAEGFFATGTKPVFRLTTREGYGLRLTGDHKVLTAASRARSTLRREWRRADELKPGDLVVLNDHRAAPAWPGGHDEAMGLSLGYLVGRRLVGSRGEQRLLRAAVGVAAYGIFELPPLPRAGEGRGEGVSELAPSVAVAASRSPHPALSRKRERG